MGRRNRHDSPEDKSGRWLFVIGAVLLLMSLLGVLCGCRSVKRVAVPVEVERTVTRTDTLRLHTHSVDTVVERDSVFVWQRGDTVTKEVTRWRYKVRLLTDTLWRARVDSVYVERPVAVTVERELTLWERAKQRWGGWALAFGGIVVLGIGAWLAFKHKIRL